VEPGPVDMAGGTPVRAGDGADACPGLVATRSCVEYGVCALGPAGARRVNHPVGSAATPPQRGIFRGWGAAPPAEPPRRLRRHPSPEGNFPWRRRLTWRVERRFELATAQTPAQAWWPLDHASSTASVRSGRLEPAASNGPTANAPRRNNFPPRERPTKEVIHRFGRFSPSSLILAGCFS